MHPRTSLREPTKMDEPERHWTVVKLGERVQQGANACQIADVVGSMWQLTEAILDPMIGRKSMASLFQRSLFLTGREYPWLANAYGGMHSPSDFSALKSVVMRQDIADAVAGGGAFLQTFYETLISLIGSAVTEQLLRALWENHLSGPPAQDTSL